MPELPEVETQVRDLQEIVEKRILVLSSNTKKAFTPVFAKFKKEIENKKILTVSRRAKYIVFSLSEKLVLLVHFRMTGHFLLTKNSTPLEKFIRHIFKLSGGTYLQFSDIRKFGTLRLVSKKDFEKLPEIQKLGIEPFSKDFTLAKFREILKSKKGKLKAVLLDQTFIVGIGNIYADEICFESRLHPALKVEKLDSCDVKNLFRAIRNQLRKGIRNRGTTIGEFVDAAGKAGKNQGSLLAYKRHGKKCKVCGKILKKIKIQQRTTTFCENCQRFV